MADNELVGFWSADVLYGPGAQSDDVLYFWPDGTGRHEFHNWILCSADFFRWRLVSPGAIEVVGERQLSPSKDMRSIEEHASSIGTLKLSYSIVEADTPQRGRIPKLELSPEWPFERVYGLACRDLIGMEEPCFDIEK